MNNSNRKQKPNQERADKQKALFSYSLKKLTHIVPKQRSPAKLDNKPLQSNATRTFMALATLDNTLYPSKKTLRDTVAKEILKRTRDEEDETSAKKLKKDSDLTLSILVPVLEVVETYHDFLWEASDEYKQDIMSIQFNL